MTKILPLLTAMYSILCTRRLQPPRDDCPVRVQWFSSVTFGAINRFGIYWPSTVLSLIYRENSRIFNIFKFPCIFFIFITASLNAYWSDNININWDYFSVVVHSICAKSVSMRKNLKNRFMNICTYLTFLSKGHSDALKSEEFFLFFAKNFLYH